jgi:PAS domain S-box-containing protein
MNEIRTKEKLETELLKIQQKYEALKALHEITIFELNKAARWSETFLSSLPYPAMYIRVKDMVIISANRAASEMGVKVGGYCWREFMKAEYLSQHDKEIANKYPDAVPSEFDIKCSFCLSENCFSGSHEQIDHEMHAFGLIWETYWIKVSEEVFLHYAINITERKKSEEELILKKQIFESSITANSISDSKGILTHCNSAFLKIWGYDSPHEVIGKPISHFLKIEDEGLKIITSLNKSGIWEGEYTGLKKDCTPFDAYGLATIIKNNKKENIGYYSAVIDITARNQAEKTLQDIIDYNPMSIQITDNDGCTLKVNQAFKKLYGSIPPSGYSMFNDIQLKVKGFEGLIDRIKKGEVVHFPDMSFNPHDSVPEVPDVDVWIRTIVFPLMDNQGKPEMFVFMHDNITERKQAERDQKDRMNELTSAYRQLDRYISDNKELKQFAYISSHQLQEPLRTISNYIQIIEEDYSEELNSTALKHFNTIKKSSGRMNSLIMALSDYSQLGLNKKLQRIDSKKIVNEVISDLQSVIETSNSSVAVSVMPVLNAYEGEFRQVFQNLLTNAIKFQKKNNHPEIKIGSEKIDGNWQFSVRDNGIGIAPDHHERIFNMYQRLHVNEEEYEGKGIGLAFCKKIIELHQGKIWVESTPGQGTTVYFTIPNLIL